MKHARPASSSRSRGGYTLLEMLMVVAIIAAVASIGSIALSGRILSRTDESLVRTEMLEIVKAIVRFKQDTGYYPGEGVFAANASAAVPFGPANSSQLVWPNRDAVTWPTSTSGGGYHAPDTAAADQVAWYNSPANFIQLLTATSPLGDLHPLSHWDPESARGWRGPYLRGFRDGYVTVAAEPLTYDDTYVYRPLDTAAAGGTVRRVLGIADPYQHRPTVNPAVPTGNPDYGKDFLALWWRVGAELNPDLWAYRGQVGDVADPARMEESRWGRPYIIKRRYSSTGQVVSRALLSAGPDGNYDSVDDNIELEF